MKAIYSGAFNPLHEGHLAIYYKAIDMGYDVVFEIAEMNVDKDYCPASIRGQQFENMQLPYVSGTEPTFVAKSFKNPDTTFIVGSDTLIRVANVSYYHNNTRLRQECIDKIIANNCKFLCFNRQENNWEQFKQHYGDLLPVEFVDFGINISSTEIRKNK